MMIMVLLQARFLMCVNASLEARMEKKILRIIILPDTLQRSLISSLLVSGMIMVCCTDKAKIFYGGLHTIRAQDHHTKLCPIYMSMNLVHECVFFIQCIKKQAKSHYTMKPPHHDIVIALT